MEKTEELQQLTEELLVQRDTLFSKNYKITKQNKKITDSIRYASRIQQAILPRNNVLDEAFPSNFILYIPKDIVSGDFFWFKRKENFVHLAAVDCTGHGVPGAMMSMLGVSLLNELISKEFEKPASILNELRERIKESLHQSQDIEDSSQTQDGADIAFCTINLDTLEMQYAGAYNPVYIIRNSISSLPEFIELKADKMPIGKHPKQDVDFNNKTLQLKKGDLIYLFTDGYHTQFGGPTGGKMKHAHFKEILMEIHNFPLAVQKQVLETRFLEWKDSLNQVDDILVMGVRV